MDRAIRALRAIIRGNDRLHCALAALAVLAFAVVLIVCLRNKYYGCSRHSGRMTARLALPLSLALALALSVTLINNDNRISLLCR